MNLTAQQVTRILLHSWGYYGNVAPRADVTQHTIEGHVWVVKDTGLTNLSVFRAARSISLAIVSSGRGSRPESQTQGAEQASR